VTPESQPRLAVANEAAAPAGDLASPPAPPLGVGPGSTAPPIPVPAAPPVVSPGPLPATGEGRTVNAALLVPASPSSDMAALPGAPMPVPVLTPPSAPRAPHPPGPADAGAVTPMAGVLPPAASVSVPGTPAQTLSATAAAASEPSAREPVSEKPNNATDSGISYSGVAVNLPPLAPLPTGVTGQDLLSLQTQLTVLEKQKAIASGQQAIAESLLKMRKAQYEMALIGRPSAPAPQAAQPATAPHASAAAAAVAPTPSPLASVRLVSTARANGAIGATINYNGKLIDVKKGSVVAGYLIDKLTDKSLTFIGEHETKTVWID
jgi:hypothetical protein